MADQSERLELRGEVGALIGSRDWSKTRLGPLETWPSSLKTMIGVMLGSRFPMMLGWGPELLEFYNDAYIPVLGVKHPASLGAPVSTVWSEIWNVVGPLMLSVLSGGPALWREHQLLFINSRGFAQETFHTFSQSPVPGDDGKVGGVLLTVQETTEQVQGERQLQTLRALAERTGVARTATEACAFGASVLEGADADVPFSLVYLLGDDGTPTLAASSPASLAGRTDLRAPAGRWPFHEALRGEPVLVEDLARRFGFLPGGRYNVRPERAVVVPLLRDERDRYGFVVFGLGAWRIPSEGYLGFLGLVASQLTSAIAHARASEEDRRRVEAMAELDRAKTLFFSNISHELRTPLTLMLGPTTDALRSRARTLEGHDLEIVHRSALRLQKLVASLLDFARIEAGRARVSLEPTHLDALTRELAHAFDPVMREAGLAYEVRCEPLPYPVLIDPDMWEKILLNLLSNALKFTFQGKVRVSLAARGEQVELEVADTGIGISATELPHVFDRFHRVQGARARTQEGSGIGLALVHELARLLGGDVAVKSVVDEGTTMTVTIPARAADAAPDALPAAREPSVAPAATRAADNRFVEEARHWLPNADAASTSTAGASPGPLQVDGAQRSARVLVVDDNADMRGYLARMLGPHWTVETAVDGEAALTSIRARRPDVVLTDVMMPNLDGFGLVARLRADEATADLPVIVLSARAGEESRIEGLQVGADDYLVKPFSARELIARVQVHVSLAQLRRRLLDRAEEARRAAEDATRAKDEFLAMLGHELRNPLSPIVMAVELMHRRGGSSRELSIIERQLKQLMRLVDDLLDVSRITRGKVDLQKERTSIAEVIKRAVETTQPLFQERQQPLALDVPGDLFVDGDPTRLQQVFANLLTNASKYSDPGAAVAVSAKSLGDRVEIRVRDHGIGIRPEMRQRVFDLFVQQPQALDRAAGGLGLGLAIVKNLVASHGGSVGVESDGPGTGSEFIVTLPSMPAAGGAARPATPGAATTAPRGSPGCRVLVVDDSVDSAAMLADSLESMGHEVRVAHDGRAALDAAAVFHPDVALLDIGLPEMSGYELAAHLRELPGGRAMRFVAATGYGRDRDRVTSMAAGFDDHLVKPVNLDRLREIVARAATAKAAR